MLNESLNQVNENLGFMVFGKHIAWADHIEDMGVFTPSLQLFKRWLYTEGVRNGVESGVWNGEGGDILKSWNHRLILKGETGWVFAYCIQSPDAKGRSSYPLVVALHVVADVFPESIESIWDVFDGFKEAAINADSQSQLREVARKCYEESVRAISDINPLDASGFGINRRKKFISQSQYGNTIEGFSRVLYRFSVDLEMFSSDKAVRATRFFRLPTMDQLDGQSLCFFELLTSQLGKNHIIGWVESLDDNFADIFVGLLDSQQIVNMKRSKSFAPPLSEVTFNISEREQRKINQFIEYYSSEQNLAKISLFTDDSLRKVKGFFNKFM